MAATSAAVVVVVVPGIDSEAVESVVFVVEMNPVLIVPEIHLEAV
jgi:predicted secreted protein